MTLLIAPDSFKGSLTAREFCEIASRAIARRCPEIEVESLPFSDGGEGFLDCLNHDQQLDQIQIVTRGADGQDRPSRLLVLEGGKTAVAEMADPCGLHWLPAKKRCVFKTTTYGLGTLIAEAANRGYQNLVIGVGGSSTHDGGAGALQGLGVRLYKRDGSEVLPGLYDLMDVASIDARNVPSSVRNLRITLATDVETPLLGEKGATYFYAKQKGAKDSDLPVIEKSLTKWSGILAEKFPQTLSGTSARSGAGGGIAMGLSALFPISFTSGFDFLSDWHNWRQNLAARRWRMIITGEGKMDDQTLNGKLVQKIAGASKELNIPAIAFLGQTQNGAHVTKKLGLTAAICIQNGPCNLEYSQSHCRQLLFDSIYRFAGIIPFLNPPTVV